MMRQFGLLGAAVILTGCAMPSQTPDPASMPAPMVVPKSDVPVPAAPPPTARTVEQFDTTSAEERAKVVKAAETPGQDDALGNTIASLGDPTQPGFWLKTPLVAVERPGRVEYAAAGTSVAVTLIPIDGPKTGGSRLSLPAMRLLDAPLTGLPEIAVFAAR